MTAKQKADDHRIPVLKVAWDRGESMMGYVHLVGTACLIDTHKRDSQDTIYGALEWPSDYDQDYAWMNNFKVWSQGKNDDQPRYLYATECVYRGMYSCDLNECRRMVKTLERIEKGLDKLNAEWGYPKGYADYLLRVAKVLKFKHMLFENTPERKERSGYTWSIRDVGQEAQFTLDRMVKTWVEECITAAA